MTRILFVCHGNICRSAMCKFIFINLINKYELSNGFIVDSAATSTEEIGNDMYPPAKALLRKKDIPFTSHAARQIRKSDYEYFDLIIGMDEYNVRNLIKYFNNDPLHKIRMLLERPISDPWYTGDFETTYEDLTEGCNKLIKEYNNHTQKATE